MHREIPFTPSVDSTNSSNDEIVALTLQLEELRSEDDRQKGKYREGEPPDATRALLEYQREVATCLQILTDLKLAHSIAHAIDTDGPIIANLTRIEVLAEEDRQTALQMSIDDPELKSPPAPPPYAENESTQSFKPSQHYHNQGPQWDISSVFGDDWSAQLGEDEDNEEQPAPGDSKALAYTKHQKAALKALGSKAINCCSCDEKFRPCDILRLECDHFFCRTCLKQVIMQSMLDKSTFPPRCCRKNIPQDKIGLLLSEEEFGDFKNTEIEVSCDVKTYCSNASCGRFIPPTQITADRAHCLRCGNSTCTNCKNAFHQDDCPEDQELQATLVLAKEQKWQRCFACRAVVILDRDCNHIT